MRGYHRAATGYGAVKVQIYQRSMREWSIRKCIAAIQQMKD